MASEARHASGTPTFAELLRRHRIAAALSQEALAERAGLSARAISDLERGVKTRPYLETVRMLADALDLTLLERTELARTARPQASPFPNLQPEWTASGLRGVIPLAAQTSLVGRSDDIALIASLLRRDDVRLITLVGPGGVGKTRLALAVADAVQADFPDGAWFIDLTAVSDPALVPSAIVQALGLSEVGGTPILDQLVTFLGGKRILLVLDNFEQIIDAAAAIADLIGRQPSLKLMVTSRMPLHISGEQEVPIEPLLLPDQDAHHPADVRDVPAVALFVQRAQLARPGFALTHENASAVSGICRRLDGLPLAIELAAARVKLMSPQALLERLEHALPLLTSGPIDRPDRHRALQATISWSYDLLDESERTLFRRLSVFRGGCTFESAEAVCNYDNSLDILGGISSLVDKSLLRCEGDEPRLKMLETIREFALDRLDKRDDRAVTRDGHAAWFLDLAEAAEPELSGPDQGMWLGKMDQEQDNFREALTQLQSSARAAEMVRLGSALWPYWSRRGSIFEGRDWLQRAVALGEAEPAVQLRAFHRLGNLAIDLGEYPVARKMYSAALDVARRSGNQQGIADALNGLGIVAADTGDLNGSQALHEEAWAIRSYLGDTTGCARITYVLGLVALAQRKMGDATRHLVQAVKLHRQLGDVMGVAYSRIALAQVDLYEGRLQDARERLQESHSVLADLGDEPGIAHVLTELGVLEQLEGNPAQSIVLLGRSLEIRTRLGDRVGIVAALERVANPLLDLGKPELAATILGLTCAEREVLGTPASPADLDYRRQTEVECLKRMSREELETTASLGRSTSVKNITLYLSELSGLLAGSDSPVLNAAG
jgi:predicted ATPase/transcriptional regulator with XRE-family HTH domain